MENPAPFAVDANLTLIILALISSLGVIINSIIGIIALKYSRGAVESSSDNTIRLTNMQHAVDGLTTGRVQAEKDVGIAKADTARAEGLALGQAQGLARGQQQPAPPAPPPGVKSVSIQTIQPGKDISVDDKDPEHPIVSVDTPAKK